MSQEKKADTVKSIKELMSPSWFPALVRLFDLASRDDEFSCYFQESSRSSARDHDESR